MDSTFSASICVFCGSRMGRYPDYENAAIQTGEMIANQGWRLVYGAGDVGLMGAVARATQSHNGATFGVIPQHLLTREVGKRDLTQFIVTENMHERKKVMFMNSDAIVVLPGGAGSLDELFEVLTWRQLGLHDKPIFLVNTIGYWDQLSGVLDQIVDLGFADSSLLEFVEVVDTIPELADKLRAALSSETDSTE